MAHPPMADPATAGTIASFAVLAILLALLVLLRPSLLVRHLLGWPICRYTPDGLKRLLESAGFVAPSIVSV